MPNGLISMVVQLLALNWRVWENFVTQINNKRLDVEEKDHNVWFKLAHNYKISNNAVIF